MEREPARHTPLGGYDININIAVVFAREGDPLAVGRKDRIGLDAGPAGKPPGIASLPAHAPQVARISKDHVRTVDGRLPKEQGRFLGAKNYTWGREQECKCQGDMF